MSTLYQILGTGMKWMLRRNHKPFSANLSLSNLPPNSRNIFVRIFCIGRSLCSQPHTNLKDVPSVESGTNRIAVPENVSSNSPSLKVVHPAAPNSNPRLNVDGPTLTMQNELVTYDDPDHKLPPRRALDEVPIEKTLEDSSFIDDIGPPLPVSFNLAAYVNMSKSLQELVKLGVDLSGIENRGHAKYIQGLDFERDMKNHIQFLHDVGVPADELGKFLTKNPLIFQEDLDNLRVRINYLEIKKFSSEAIARIVTKCPWYLSLEVKTVDSRLGFLQRTFKLLGNEVRFLITKCPRLVSYKYEKLMERIFVIKEGMGFSDKEMKQMLLMKPKLYMYGIKSLTTRFNVVHNMMGISHEHILHFPAIFLTRDFILTQRHKYLVKCGRAQYDPTKPNYVSLKEFAALSDGEFCRKYAKTSVSEFNEFLKTL